MITAPSQDTRHKPTIAPRILTPLRNKELGGTMMVPASKNRELAPARADETVGGTVMEPLTDFVPDGSIVRAPVLLLLSAVPPVHR